MSVEGDYKVIARALASVSPTDFEEARLHAHVEDDWLEKSYRCRVNGDWSKRLSVPSDLDFQVDEALERIRETMKHDGQEPWTDCTFYLPPSGKFRFEVKYAD